LKKYPFDNRKGTHPVVVGAVGIVGNSR